LRSKFPEKILDRLSSTGSTPLSTLLAETNGDVSTLMDAVGRLKYLGVVSYDPLDETATVVLTPYGSTVAELLKNQKV
jgi:hypothetical protein